MTLGKKPCDLIFKTGNIFTHLGGGFKYFHHGGVLNFVLRNLAKAH